MKKNPLPICLEPNPRLRHCMDCGPDVINKCKTKGCQVKRLVKQEKVIRVNKPHKHSAVSKRLRADLQLAAETLRRYEDIERIRAVGFGGCVASGADAMRKAEANATIAARFEQTLKETM